VKRTFVIMAVGLALLAAEVASAHVRTPLVNHRQSVQRARIREGWRSGDLTRREHARLRAGQARIHRMEWRAKRDGHVTLGERRRLIHAQNHESRAIHRLKHDRRTRQDGGQDPASPRTCQG